ncbi:hypothetical protein [Pseudomonas sp. MS15a(2019)]|uniref:hypothetical protein n=1 Tax=Pseudomonas sp. MS15a(2019) TaxID=2579938 RepID=UPI0015634217|nr:hypothetical protein [Pseudomonas sp. MS15a(2019)]NRH40663.1 hypothetical protein [Pseudomonas sp. MS15a(2019)]
MASYVASKFIPSVYLDKALIKSLEVLFKSFAQKYYADSGEEASKVDMQLSIFDKAGMERLVSIDEYQYPRFTNDTRSISLGFEAVSPSRSFSINIKFGPARSSSRISVVVSMVHAKAIAQGIISDVVELLKQHSNLNFIFHYQLVWAFQCLLGSIALFNAGRYWNNWEDVELLVPAAASALLGVLMAVNKYTTLDTRRNSSIEKYQRSLIFALGGTVVFGGIGKLLWG